MSFATLTPVRVSSDVEQVVLRTTTLPKVGFGHRSGQVWALGGVHDREERREAAHETRGQEEEAPAKVPLSPVRQRLRWIPPGRFLMGSPPDEEGRYSDEGPQHEVTIAEGFWMFDTPCTQCLGSADAREPE